MAPPRLRFPSVNGPLGLVTFSVGGRRMALELRSVARVVAMVKVTPLPNAPDVVLGAIDVAGEAMPVYDVRRRLGLQHRPYGADAVLLLAHTGSRAVAVAADAIGAVRTIDAAAVASAETLAPGLEHLAGVAALDDGLILIQDLDAFLTADEERRLALAEAEAAQV
jgi:purine-binding chemotaxis protein CheW